MKPLPPLYRRLLAYPRRYLFPHMALMAAAMLLLSSTEGSIVLILKRFIDQLSVAHNLAALQILSLIVLAIFLVRAAAAFGSDYLEAYVIQKVTLDLRAELNESLQNQSLSFFNRTPTGVMLSRVINDVQVVTSGAVDSMFAIFSNGTRLIAVLAAAFYIDWEFALIAFVVFPAAVLPVIKFSKGIPRTRSAS